MVHVRCLRTHNTQQKRLQMIALALPPSAPAPLSDDEFLLDVKIADAIGCQAPLPVDVANLANSGMRMSLLEVVRNGTLFNSLRSVPRVGETEDLADIRRVVQLLEDWQPRVLSDSHGNPRLIVNTSPNGETSKPVSELLGEAVGLQVGIFLSGVDFKFWSKRHYQAGVRHDFEAEGAFGRVIVETRGRFEANNCNQALDGIGRKFSNQTRRFSRSIGTVYCPRTDPNDSQDDLTLADPVGDVPADPLERRRRLLLHYAALLRLQGTTETASLLFRAAWLGSGEVTMPAPTFRPGGDQWGRASISVAGTRYWGTFWEGGSLPTIPIQPGSNRRTPGPTFFGIAFEVVNALARLDMPQLESSDIAQFRGALGSYAYLRSSDGLIMAYALDDTSILTHPR
jgi:hypothetical protein